MDFADFLDSDDDKMENNEAEANSNHSDVSKTATNVTYSGKQLLLQIPRGWLRKIITSGSGVSTQRNVCYLSPAGVSLIKLIFLVTDTLAK
jgi:hypothetical protein